MGRVLLRAMKEKRFRLSNGLVRVKEMDDGNEIRRLCEVGWNQLGDTGREKNRKDEVQDMLD